MRFLSVLILCCTLASPAHAETPLPADSLYQAGMRLTDQNGKAMHLADLRGKVQLASMIYTRCQMVCPMIVETMKMTALALGTQTSNQLGLLAISFDSAHDDVSALRTYAVKHKLNLQDWTLAHADSKDVRTLAALLGIKYRQLPDGEFNHSTALVVLDKDGRLVARTDVMGRVDPALIAALRQQLEAP